MNESSRMFAGMMTLVWLTGCGSGSVYKSGSEWDDINYSTVYRNYQSRENDANYKQPTVMGCVDDDLYNCK